jgi:ferredoxin-NADP reductase
MRYCSAILKGRDTLCDGTTGLYFEKPHGFEFKPGQFANFTLDSVITTDAGGITRSLSIASAPHEKDLMVAMRMRETAFKRVANGLPIGAPFLLEGPYGNLILSLSCRWHRHYALSKYDPAFNRSRKRT